MFFKNPDKNNAAGTFERNLRRAARALPAEAVPDTLRARVSGALPMPNPTNKRRQFVSRLAAAGAVATVAAVGFAVAPRSFVTRSYAAEMRRAIANARTWHFSGWRLVEGKRVAWEVWGRRTPFLYRETIGGETVYDDGVRRVHILPPGGSEGRERGLYLVTPSERLKSAAPNGVGFLAGTGGENTDFGRFVPIAGDSSLLQGETIVDALIPRVARRERTRLTISTATFLPVRYSVAQERYTIPVQHPEDVPNIPRDAVPNSVETTALLTPEYDVPLPRGMTKTPLLLARYTVADATTGSDVLPRGDTVCTRKGLTVLGSVVGQDTAGNLHLRFDGWLGREAVRYKTQGLMLELRTNLRAEDEYGNRYLYVSLPLGVAMNSEHPELWLTPVEPLPARAPKPRRLKLDIGFGLERDDSVGNSGNTVEVIGDYFVFTLPLPAAKAPIGYDAVPSRFGDDYRGVRPTFRMETAEKRGEYYMDAASEGSFTRSPDGRQQETAESKNRKRAAFAHAISWYSVVETEAVRTHNAMMRRLAQDNLRLLREMTTKLSAP